MNMILKQEESMPQRRLFPYHPTESTIKIQNNIDSSNNMALKAKLIGGEGI